VLTRAGFGWRTTRKTRPSRTREVTEVGATAVPRSLASIQAGNARRGAAGLETEKLAVVAFRSGMRAMATLIWAERRMA
jgi:hypothetical protein